MNAVNNFDKTALKDAIVALQSTEKMNVETAFDRPYINHYIGEELEKWMNQWYKQGKRIKDAKVLEFYGNDQRWMEHSDLITSKDEASAAFWKAGGTIATDLDDEEAVDLFLYRSVTELKEGEYIGDMTNRYDLIICPQVLCYSLNPINMLSNLKHMLKSGGTLILTTSGPIYPDFYGTGFTLFYTLEAIEKLVKKVFRNDGLIRKAAYGNTEHVMRTLAYVNHGKLTEQDFKHRENSLSIIVAATARKA